MTRDDVLRNCPCDVCKAPIDLNEGDIANAVRSVPGYLDISTTDLLLVYRLARQFALRRDNSHPLVDHLMREQAAVQAMAKVAPLQPRQN